MEVEYTTLSFVPGVLLLQFELDAKSDIGPRETARTITTKLLKELGIEIPKSQQELARNLNQKWGTNTSDYTEVEELPETGLLSITNTIIAGGNDHGNTLFAVTVRLLENNHQDDTHRNCEIIAGMMLEILGQLEQNTINNEYQEINTDERYSKKMINWLGLEDPDLHYLSITPNWLSGASPNQTVDGGPGGKPMEVPIGSPETINKPNTRPEDNYNFVFENKPQPENTDTADETTAKKGLNDTLFMSRKRTKSPHNVDVFILDTAPKPRVVQEAMAEYGSEHPLLDGLFGVNGKLDVHYNFRLGQQLEPDTTLCKESCTEAMKMPDHGLFIAGLIHAIAPHANLHLIEVLDEHGVGSLQSILWGLTKIKGIQDCNVSTVSAIINCSFVFELRYDAKHRSCYNANSGTNTTKLLNKLGSNESLSQFMLSAFIRFASQVATKFSFGSEFKKTGAMVFAASGNDGQGEDPINRPPALYPAAFPDVQGVAALNHADGKGMVSYSNKADRQAEEGYRFFGGDVGKTNDGNNCKSEKGLLSVYIHDLIAPLVPIEAKAKGWALWSGTSFATGVASGLMAQLLGTQSGNDRQARIKKSIEVLKNVKSSTQGDEPPDEVHVVQEYTKNVLKI